MNLLNLLFVVSFLFPGNEVTTPENPEQSSLPIPPPQSERKIQMAILFDTSNSMDGLIDQAKSRIWSIVNELSTLRYQGALPSIEIALYEYGKSSLEANDHYVRKIVDLTTDLDLISKELFALTTNGGDEYCGAVMDKSLDQLQWSNHSADLKMIYIAGNEPFNQGPVDYKKICPKAKKANVLINTIYCGPYDQGVKEFWQDGATCSGGDYFNIDSDKKVQHIDTPYDVQIQQYNDSLNTTYMGYGSMGREKKSMQMAQDANAESVSSANKAERSIAKSKASYKNSSWDLLDAVEEDKVNINDLDESELPVEFKGKSEKEKKELLETKQKDRDRYQRKISDLATERQKYIDAELKKKAESGEAEDDFGTSINESINKSASAIGYEKE